MNYWLVEDFIGWRNRKEERNWKPESGLQVIGTLGALWKRKANDKDRTLDITLGKVLYVSIKLVKASILDKLKVMDKL